jgi:hypothetical protein
MLTTCSEPGCATLVMGGRCLEHERRPSRVFVRGRPVTGGLNTDATGYGVAKRASDGSLGTLDVRSNAHLELELPRR